jgi:hypothetical protein
MIIPVTQLPDSLAEYLNNYADILNRPQQYHFQMPTDGDLIMNVQDLVIRSKGQKRRVTCV